MSTSLKDFSQISKALTELCFDINILYVERDSHIKDEVTRSLKRYFRDFDFVSTGDEALFKLTSRRYDILVINLKTLKIDACEFIVKIRKLNRRQRIIVTAAQCTFQETFDLINMGINGYILKPFPMRSLLSQLSRVSKQTYEDKMLLQYVDELEHEASELRKNQKPTKQVAPVVTIEEKIIANDLFFDDDVFFDMDDGNVDLEHLHVSDDNKITASELFEQGWFDPYAAEDIIDSSKALIEILDVYEFLSSEYLDEVIKRIQIFSTNLITSAEFGNLAGTLIEFNLALQKLSAKFDSNDESNALFKQFIDAVIADLISWTNEVLINKSANDVHYLDASLLSSIIMINSMIENK
jgi:DNA-binding response OmpR family regulator